jgi:hypothetical protein
MNFVRPVKTSCPAITTRRASPVGQTLRHPLEMDKADVWQQENPNVMVVLADEPAPGTDWRAQEGWGWIFKAWFRTWGEARQARAAIRAEGWEPEFWGRKLRVGVADGHDGQRLADFVIARWPNVRIQLRND